MAGLIDVNILKPELAGSFAAGYRGAEQARQQSEMNQLKLDQLKQDRAMLTELQTKLRAAGHSDDPQQFFRAMIETGNPDYVAKGYEGLQRYKELQNAEKFFGFGEGAPAPANALVGGAAPAAAPAAAPTGGLAGMTFGGQVGPAPAGLKVSPEDKAYQQAADQWMMGGMQGPAPTRAGAAPANALAPIGAAPAAPTNALAPSAAPSVATGAALNPQAIMDRINQMSRFAMTVRDPGVAAKLNQQIGILERQLELAGRLKPAEGTQLSKLIAERDKLSPTDPNRKLYDAEITKLTTHPPGTTVNVSTEKKYGERFAGLLAERDATKLDAAEKAPELASSANRIIDLVQQGNVFTGPAADIKLNIARVMNVAGANNEQKIANTEALIAATGKSTLDAIKGAGLGTGQGFTDKDLKFLQGVAGGTIGLTRDTLMELARLQHRTAVKSAEAWNKRVKELPPDVIKGTALSTAPISVPALSSVMKKEGAAATVSPNIDALLDKYK